MATTVKQLRERAIDLAGSLSDLVEYENDFVSVLYDVGDWRERRLARLVIFEHREMTDLELQKYYLLLIESLENEE